MSCAPTESHGSLTSSSLGALWKISFPLMLSLLSSSLMYFWDRLLLAQVSLDFHNAAASAGSMALSMQYLFICTASIAEVFVGKANGANLKSQIAVPVWQMNWLALFSVIFFVPVGLFAGNWLFAASAYRELEVDYFSYLLYFGPIFCLNSSLSAFYIGRGAVGFATFSMIAANVVNMALAYILIFGWPPLIAPCGLVGAAIAMGASQVVQALILGVNFLSAENRRTFSTGNYQFQLKPFMRCLRVGLPSSFAHTLEMFAWALFFQMLGNVSEEHLTVASIGQSVFFLFTFITEGVSKGAMTLAANMIGAKAWGAVWRLLFTGIKFYLIMFVALGALFLFAPHLLVDLFVASDGPPLSPTTYSALLSACFWVWIFLLFDGIHWLVVGMLTAVGDTHFILKAGSTAIWLFALLPTYLLVVLWGYPGETAWAMIAFYGIAICAIYLQRFRYQHSQLATCALSI